LKFKVLSKVLGDDVANGRVVVVVVIAELLDSSVPLAGLVVIVYNYKGFTVGGQVGVAALLALDWRHYLLHRDGELGACALQLAFDERRPPRKLNVFLLQSLLVSEGEGLVEGRLLNLHEACHRDHSLAWEGNGALAYIHAAIFLL